MQAIQTAQVIRTLVFLENVDVGPLMLVQEIRLFAIVELAKVRICDFELDSINIILAFYRNIIFIALFYTNFHLLFHLGCTDGGVAGTGANQGTCNAGEFCTAAGTCLGT